ncbi:MAG: polyamine aminopropyltransferase [Deltaproteobacteria bacterium]|nr:polyamine aminopropyltransferase [Deltaproteobacteria bacterium]
MNQIAVKSNKAFKPFSESMVLYISMFVMGGCGLAYEYTLSKLCSDLLGNSVEQWAVIIGVMMFFMGIGSDVQKYFQDKELFSKFLFAQMLLGLGGAFGPIVILDAYGRFPQHFVIIQYFFISAIGLLIGFEIPLLTRINSKYSKEIKFNIGGILKMDYIGALCGALIWVFVLPKFFSTTKMAFVLGLMNIAVAGFALIYFYALIEKRRLVSLAIIVSFSLVTVGYFIADQWTSYAEQALYRDRIVYAKTSKYQHLVITEKATGSFSFFINGHLQFNSNDEYIYHENLVHPAMLIAPKKERVLILGGGDGLAAREVLKYKEVKELTLCDIDPMVVELARFNQLMRTLNQDSLFDARLHLIKNKALMKAAERDLWTPDHKSLSPRKMAKVSHVTIINVDAMKFIEQVQGQYDVVIVDFPDPNAPELAKLYSQSFYQLLRKQLAPGAVFVQQSTSPYYAKEAFLNIGRTIKSAGFAAIPYHEDIPSMGDWGFWIAGDTKWYSEKSLRMQFENADTTNIPLQYLTNDTKQASLAFGAQQLISSNNDINTLTSAVVYRYYLKGWQQYF